jgi:hypothetical protein
VLRVHSLYPAVEDVRVAIGSCAAIVTMMVEFFHLYRKCGRLHYAMVVQ